MMGRVISAVALAALLLGAGCAGADGKDGRDGAPTLLATATEPAGANFPHGGTAVHSGIDLDGDGILDLEEISATAYVCGSAGVVVRAGNAPVSDSCRRGGARVESGVDDDGDGVLDDTEVDLT